MFLEKILKKVNFSLDSEQTLNKVFY